MTDFDSDCFIWWKITLNGGGRFGVCHTKKPDINQPLVGHTGSGTVAWRVAANTYTVDPEPVGFAELEDWLENGTGIQ